MEAVLAAAHKYGVTRLLRWCEQQLCEQLTPASAVSLLELARLYEASQLRLGCLQVMKAHMGEVVTRPEFAALSQEALVLFHRHCAGVDPEEADGHKRKRDD